MSKPWVRCSCEIRSLTNELSQMRRELRTIQWSLVGVILLVIFLFLWMSRMRSTTTSTNGRSVETISIQSSPPESLVMLPRREATTEFVRRRFVSTNSHNSTQHECDAHSAAGDVGFVLSQKPSVVARLQRCLCVPHAKWTHPTRPTFQQYPELQRMVEVWWAKLQRRQG